MRNLHLIVTKVSDENKWMFQIAIWKTTNKFNATIIGVYHPPILQ